jgi:hypothetical protein
VLSANQLRGIFRRFPRRTNWPWSMATFPEIETWRRAGVSAVATRPTAKGMLGIHDRAPTAARERTDSTNWEKR